MEETFKFIQILEHYFPSNIRKGPNFQTIFLFKRGCQWGMKKLMEQRSIKIKKKAKFEGY